MTDHPHALLMRAASFAAHAHRDQRRKGPGEQPYINHPLEVAHVLASVGNLTDPALLCAAILHDTVEDTTVESNDLLREFGDEIAGLVAEVTDDKSLPKDERKQLQVDHMPGKSDRAKALKVADKICNVRDLAHSLPASWTVERALTYVDWAEHVIAGARGMFAELEAEFDRVCAEARAALRGA